MLTANTWASIASTTSHRWPRASGKSFTSLRVTPAIPRSKPSTRALEFTSAMTGTFLNARAFRKVPVIADVNSNARVLGLERGIAGVTGSEVKLFPEARGHLWDVVLAILAQVFAVSIDHRSRIVVEACHLFLIDRDHDHHAVFGCDFLHQLDCGAVRDRLSQLIPAGALLRAEIRAVKNFLKAQHLDLLFRRLFNQLQVFFNHGFFDLFERLVRAQHVAGLDQAAAHNSRHRHLTQLKSFDNIPQNRGRVWRSEERRVGKECRSRW